MNLKDFSANDARLLKQNINDGKLYSILESIYSNALKGQRYLTSYSYIPREIQDELKKRGFEIEDTPSIAVQKDGVYHYIKW